MKEEDREKYVSRRNRLDAGSEAGGGMRGGVGV